MADVIAAAKARPGEVVYGSAGNGNTMHLAGELFQARSGARLLPDGPTMAESGLPDATSVVWNGILVKSGTPMAVVERLSKAMQAVLASPEFRAPIEAAGFDVLSSSPAEFRALLEKDHARLGGVIQRAGIKLE